MLVIVYKFSRTENGMDDATYSSDPFIQVSFEELLSKALLLFGFPAFISSWSRKSSVTFLGQYLSSVCHMLVSSVLSSVC